MTFVRVVGDIIRENKAQKKNEAYTWSPWLPASEGTVIAVQTPLQKCNHQLCPVTTYFVPYV